MAEEEGRSIPNIPPVIVPSEENIVSTVYFRTPLDLEDFASRFYHTVYIPERNFAVIRHPIDPEITALVFACGKMICIGAKTQLQATGAAKKLTRIIQKRNIRVRFKDFKILKFPFRVENYAYASFNEADRDDSYIPEFDSPDLLVAINHRARFGQEAGRVAPYFKPAGGPSRGQQLDGKKDEDKLSSSFETISIDCTSSLNG